MILADAAAEFRLLGSIIDKPDSVTLYNSELFTGDRKYVYDAMKHAYLAYGDISAEGVERFYGRMLPPELEMARGVKPGAILDKLLDLATRRQLDRLQQELLPIIANGNINRKDLIKKLTLPPILTKEDSTLTPGIVNFISDFTRKRDGNYKFIATGLSFLDHMLGGEWPRQAITILIGAVGGGKTALIVNSALKMAMNGTPSLIFSLEMTKDRLISRMAANIAQVDGMRIRRGDLSAEEQDRLNAALAVIQGLEDKLFIIDRPGLSIDDINQQIRSHREAHGVEAVFVDYIQIVDRPGFLTDHEALGHVAQQLKNIAIDLDISVIALAQQNRQFEGTNSISGSSKIGQTADVVVEIELDKTAATGDDRLCRLIFHKNRDGAVGEANCMYKAKYLQFV